MPIHDELDVDRIIVLNPAIAKKYATVNRATVLRDLKELQDLDLVVKIGRKFKPNTTILKAMMPDKRVDWGGQLPSNPIPTPPLDRRVICKS
jgi:hypothetical protein